MLKKIAIFCGGPSSEYEVSLKSAQAIAKHIDKKRYDAYFFYISKTKKAKLYPANKKTKIKEFKATSPLVKQLLTLREQNFYCLLSGIHGEFVEDGELQKILDKLDLPYSGSGSNASKISMDKFKTNKFVENIPNLKIPPTTVHSDSIDQKKLVFPLVIKPNALGSSVGVFIVKSIKEFNSAIDYLHKKLNITDILIQKCIENSLEVSCGCLQKKDGSFITIPPIEIHPSKSDFFDYESKYSKGGANEITPPIILSNKLQENIIKISQNIHIKLGLKTYSRSDFLISKNEIFFLETNTQPGMTSTSLLPKEAAAAGISYTKLIDFIIENS